MVMPTQRTATHTETMAVVGQILHLIDTGRLDEAEALMTAAQFHTSPAPQALYMQAMIAYGRGDHRLAKVKFNRAVKAAPGRTLPLIGLGNACLALGEADGALKAYRAALAIEPENSAIFNNIGTAERAAGRLDAAEAALKRALELHPENAAAMLNLAETRLARGDSVGALALLEPLGDAPVAEALRARIAGTATA
jgi:Tfp pilus assembly protein PilF